MNAHRHTVESEFFKASAVPKDGQHQAPHDSPYIATQSRRNVPHMRATNTQIWQSQHQSTKGYASQSSTSFAPTRLHAPAHHLQRQPNNNPPPTHVSQQQSQPTSNAITDLIPYCTTEPPLRHEEVIAISDIAGSLKELMLLALGASVGDETCGERLVQAVGHKTAGNIVDFFVVEWEVI